MKKETLHQFRWFWAWNDEKEEAWLSEMAQQGWHLNSVGLPGNYNFERGEPSRTFYRLDYMLVPKKERPAYLQLFQDAGWEHVGEMSNWQYFRKTVPGTETPEIYTDAESKVKKYTRLLGLLMALLPIFIITLTHSPSDPTRVIYEVGRVIALVFILAYVYAIFRLSLRIIKLRKH